MITLIKSRKNNGNGIVLFSIFLLLHILPLFSVDILLTLDGPSHLYNASLYNDLLAGNEFISELLEINTEIVPNYTGHLILSAFIWLAGPLLALKIIHIIYVLGIAISFRRLILALSPKGGLISLLIFPFIYSELFFYGFYNFSLAIIFLFITTRYWIINNQRKDIVFFIVLSLLFFVTYLSHSFTFLLLCLTIGVFVLVEAVNKKDYWSIFYKGIKAFFMALPSIILSLMFILKRESSHYDFWTSSKLWSRAFNMSCLKKFEEGETFFFVWIIILALSYTQFNQRENINNRHYAFLLLSIIISILYFFMPDGIGYACFFSVRYLYLAVLFFIIWLSLQQYSKLVVGLLVVSIFVFQIQRLEKMKTWSVYTNNKAKELITVGDLIPENSIIKPITQVNMWHFLHLSSFMGINKSQLILDNYEAGNDYFPVIWKYNLEWKNKYESKEFFKTSINGKEYTVDYLVVIGDGKTDDLRELKQIEIAEKSFPKIYQSYFVSLYKVEL